MHNQTALSNNILWEELPFQSRVDYHEKALVGSGYVKDVWFHLKELKAVLTFFCILAHNVLILPGIRNALAQVPALATNSSAGTSDGMRRKSGTWVGWLTTKDARLPLKYSILDNAVYSKKHPGSCQKNLGHTLVFLTSEGLANLLIGPSLHKRVLNMPWLCRTMHLAQPKLSSISYCYHGIL